MTPQRPTPNRQERKNDSAKANLRRGQIVNAAQQLFLKKGYEGTSLQDIADEVGLLKGSLFYYINEKEDLLHTILVDIYSDFLASIDEISATDEPPLVKIRRISEAHVRLMLTTNRQRVTIFYSDFRSLSETRRAEIQAERDYYARQFSSLVLAARDNGDLCPDLDVKLASGAVLGMLNMVYEWYPHSDDARVRRLAQEMADLVVSSLQCADPGSHVAGHRRAAGQA